MKKFLVTVLCTMFFAFSLNAKTYDWTVEQTVLIPSTIQINEGTTKNGNPKCWIVIEDMKVNVSPSNANKFKKGEIQLELVKWRNSETKKVRYSVRQAGERKSAKEVKDINLDNLF